MNNHKSTELLETIADLQRTYPDWRLGQLIANVAGWADQEIWDIEDDRLLDAARFHLQQLTAAEPAVSAER